MLERMGLTTPPCGVPLRVAWYVHSSRYPASNSPFISRRKRPSWIFSPRIDNMTEWSRLSKACGDVSLDEPGCAHPRALDLLKGHVAPSARPKPVRARGELRLEVGLQEHAEDFLQQLVRPDGDPERALLFRVLLLDIDAPRWRPPVALEAQGLDDRIDVAQGHAVGRLGRGARCQRPLVGGDPSERLQVQLPVEQVPVDPLQRQPSAASVLDDSQQGCGALHYADLAPWVIETPASLRHVDGFPALGLLRRLRRHRARAP